MASTEKNAKSADIPPLWRLAAPGLLGSLAFGLLKMLVWIRFGPEKSHLVQGLWAAAAPVYGASLGYAVSTLAPELKKERLRLAAGGAAGFAAGLFFGYRAFFEWFEGPINAALAGAPGLLSDGHMVVGFLGEFTEGAFTGLGLAAACAALRKAWAWRFVLFCGIADIAAPAAGRLVTLGNEENFFAVWLNYGVTGYVFALLALWNLSLPGRLTPGSRNVWRPTWRMAVMALAIAAAAFLALAAFSMFKGGK